MYLDYWGLSEFPFSNVPDSRFFYKSRAHRESLTRLSYLCTYQHGAGILVGPFGSGKTLLGFVLLNSINQEDRFRSAFIRNPRVSPLELLQLIAGELGALSMPRNKAEALKSIETCLHNNILDGRHTIIMIDEAHSIEGEDVFEEVRLLLNFQLEDAHLLTLILIGQPGIDVKVDRHKPLSQHVNLIVNLSAFSLSETEGYIRHRLQVVGRRDEVFNAEAMGALFRVSGGLPRRINHLCDSSLLEGFLADAEQVDREIVLQAASISRSQRSSP
jgi:general secretion pathway protein A